MKTEKFDYEIKLADYEDVPAIVEAALEFWNESEYHKGSDRPNPKRYADFITENIGKDGRRCIIAISEGKVLGYIMIYCSEPDYKDGLDGDLYQFFTHPQARGSTISRDLVEMAEQCYDDWGCNTRYAVLSAEIGKAQLSQCQNLFGKFGYEVTGIIMTKRR